MVADKDPAGERPAPGRVPARRGRTLPGLVLAAAVGVAAGAGGYTFAYARGASYMTDDPRACANCHVMNDQYDGWMRSSHRQAAVCNDCHTPENVVGKYLTKANNGLHHSIAFTSGDFHEPIAIKARNLEVTEARCRSCHADVVAAIDPGAHGPDALSCVRCHADVGHRH
jgi:cytochrome c nitrite reductase small subunit